MIRFLNWLGLVEGVYLQDCWGATYETFVSRRSPFGVEANIYPFAGVGQVLLLPGGKTGGPSSYISEWRPMNDGLSRKQRGYLMRLGVIR